MDLSSTSKTGLTVVVGIGMVVWLSTLYVFFSFVDTHNNAFLFALSYVSLLELLAFSYFAVPFIPTIRQRLVTALYPAFGIVIGIYIIRALVISLFTHTVPFLNSPRVHILSVVFGLLPFLVLMGILLLLNVWQREQTDQIRSDRAELASIASGVTEIYQLFINSRSYLGEAGFQAVEPLLKKLDERFRFCTPFHNQPKDPPQIREEIQRELTSLKEQIDALPVAPKEEGGPAAESLRLATLRILQLLERREKLLVK